MHAWGLLKEATIIFITSTIVWPQVKQQEGTQLHLPTENWIKDLQSMAKPIRTSPLSQLLPSGPPAPPRARADAVLTNYSPRPELRLQVLKSPGTRGRELPPPSRDILPSPSGAGE